MSGKKNPPYKRTLLLVGFALAVLAFAAALLFGAVLFQEGNPVPVAQALSRLELSGDRLVRIAGEPVKYVQKAGPEEPLTEYLAARGWELQERLGAAVFYEKENETLFAESRMLTRRYVVYELDREP